MSLKRKPALIPCQGIDFSKPATFIDDRSGFPTNMRYFKSEMRKRPGRTRLSAEQTDDATQVMGLGKLEQAATGSKYLVRASKAKLELYNTSTTAWSQIGDIPFTGGDDDFFAFCNVTEDGLLIVTNYINEVRKYSGSGLTEVLGGSPPKAKFCEYVSPYLLLAYTNDGLTVNPHEIIWCDTNNPEEWNLGNAGSAVVASEPSPLRNIKKIGDYLAVYKQESLWLGRKVDNSDVWQFDIIKTGLGLAASRALVEADGLHYFMAANDFYVFNGIREQSIGEKVREEVFGRLSRAKIGRCFANHVQELNEIWFYIVISGYDWPTEIWKYNYRTGFWFKDTCDEITSAIKWERVNTQSWDDDTPGSWDEAQDVWDAGVSVASWEDIVEGTSDGYTNSLDYTTTNDNGSAVESFFDSKDFVGDVLELNKRWLQLDVWARGPGKLFVDYSIDEGVTWVNVPYTSALAYAQLDSNTQQYNFYLDAWSPQIRFRFRNDVAGETFFLRNFLPYYLNREEKKT